jgi:protein gp37
MNNVRDTIGWADYTINPVTGKCPRACHYCYSNRMYDRFKWNPEIEFHPERLDEIAKLKKPSRIFVGSTHDLFGDWIPRKWIDSILFHCSNPSHAFFFLTKNPLRYSGFQFNKNQWAGVTDTGEPAELLITHGKLFSEIVIGWDNQPHCFLSCEPLLGDAVEIPSKCEWIIIGALTGPKAKQYQPKLEWIMNLKRRADVMNIPIYMKKNLTEAWKPNRIIQEFPKGVPK